MSNRVRIAFFDKRNGFYRGLSAIKYLEQAVAQYLKYPFSLLHLAPEKVARAKQLFNLLKSNDADAAKCCNLLVTREARRIRFEESKFKQLADKCAGRWKAPVFKFQVSTPAVPKKKNPFAARVMIDGNVFFYLMRSTAPAQIAPPGYSWRRYNADIYHLYGPSVNYRTALGHARDAERWLADERIDAKAHVPGLLSSGFIDPAGIAPGIYTTAAPAQNSKSIQFVRLRNNINDHS